MQTDDFEKLGAFYLGRPVDADSGDEIPTPLLYDAKDLTTHAVVLGMTGSGKTGLAIGLLEEALIDGVPVIAIDPKGDLGNLLLTFPKLEAADFRPWIDEGAAARAGETPDAFAASQAKLWREGLAKWGQGPERIARLEAAADRVFYTPGSRAGTPLSILRSLDAPAPALLADDEALRDRVGSSVSGLLGLLGLDADPIQSREHILLATLVDRAWREGRGLDLATLIHQIQRPPVERVGILDVETFFPARERFALAMRLNNLLAAPGFSAWLEGEPLDIDRMLRAPDGRPRLSIVSIAHLSDAERMFVVTLVLGQLVAWMRAQSGSQSLRAILYMDEIFGYFPPTANPPSKTPMLTLLKQARAYGLGCVPSTQNPVDLDYKGLANCGTWFLGRLQTERDKARVIEGLESAASDVAGRFDRATLDRTLSRLGSRTFLLNNVHEDEPVLMRTRWALSYLAGPLSREQIKRLGASPAEGGRASAHSSAAAPTAAEASIASPPREALAPVGGAPASERPVVPTEAGERFLPVTHGLGAGDRLVYRPVLLGQVSTHYAKAGVDVDEWTTLVLSAPLDPDLEGSPWSAAQPITGWPELEDRPEPDVHAAFAALPAAVGRAASWKSWPKKLVTHVYREHPLALFASRRPKLVSRPGEEEGTFRGRVADALREERDLEVEKLRKRYAPKLARVQEKLDRASDRVEREERQYEDRRNQTLVSVGATIVGALFGRKLGSVGNVSRTASAAKNASRAAREKADIDRAEARVDEVERELADLEAEFRDALTVAEERAAEAADTVEIETLDVRARKSDLEVQRLSLVWVPWRVGPDGVAAPVGSTPI
jgi:DNA helicase HerA-like ATPase